MMIPIVLNYVGGDGYEMDGGLPYVKVKVNHRISHMILDTGAKISYIDHSFTDGIESVGTENDFFSALWRFYHRTLSM